jgi:hypothetical protein
LVCILKPTVFCYRMFIGSIFDRNHNAENPVRVFATERSDRLSQRRNKFLWWVENIILFFSQQTETQEACLTYCSWLLITEAYILLTNRKRNWTSASIIQINVWKHGFNISAVDGREMSFIVREGIQQKYLFTTNLLNKEKIVTTLNISNLSLSRTRARAHTHTHAHKMMHKESTYVSVCVCVRAWEREREKMLRTFKTSNMEIF